MKEGIRKAAEMIDSGAALQKLEDFIRETNS
jgi:anthranilate phosphoribosyltransferase